MAVGRRQLRPAPTDGAGVEGHGQGTFKGSGGDAVGATPGRFANVLLRRNEVADAGIDRFRGANVEVDAQGIGDFFPENRAQGFPRGAPHHFPKQIALGQGVIAARAAGFPPRGLGAKARRDIIMVVERFPLGWRV